MNYYKKVAKEGSIKQERFPVYSRKTSKGKQDEYEEIQICLNCTKKKCIGHCEKVGRKS